MNMRLLLFLSISLLGLGVHADEEPAEQLRQEEITCADASADFSKASSMQISVVSKISNRTGLRSYIALLGSKHTIGAIDDPKISDFDQIPKVREVRINDVKGQLTFDSQASLSRGNGVLKIRQATLTMPDQAPKTFLCFYSDY